MLMMILKIIFGILVCVPIIYLAGYLFTDITMDAANTSKKKRPKKHKIFKFLDGEEVDPERAKRKAEKEAKKKAGKEDHKLEYKVADTKAETETVKETIKETEEAKTGSDTVIIKTEETAEGAEEVKGKNE